MGAFQYGKFKYDSLETKFDNSLIETKILNKQSFYLGETHEGKAHGFGILMPVDSKLLIWIGYFHKGRAHGYFTCLGLMMDKYDRVLGEPTLPYINYAWYQKDQPEGIQRVFNLYSEILINYDTPTSGFWMEKESGKQRIEFWRFKDGLNNNYGFGFTRTPKLIETGLYLKDKIVKGVTLENFDTDGFEPKKIL